MSSALHAGKPYAKRSDAQLLVGNGTVELRHALRRGRPLLTGIAGPAGVVVDVEDLGFVLELSETSVKTLGMEDFDSAETVARVIAVMLAESK